MGSIFIVQNLRYQTNTKVFPILEKACHDGDHALTGYFDKKEAAIAFSQDPDLKDPVFCNIEKINTINPNNRFDSTAIDACLRHVLGINESSP